mmetsp:Transcript_34921/g.112136  ORF Transcript_34921/g.112136 Transcript_34921/m.112136 type:complete len:256 (+) Transcript_34921:480-1247(+)
MYTSHVARVATHSATESKSRTWLLWTWRPISRSRSTLPTSPSICSTTIKSGCSRPAETRRCASSSDQSAGRPKASRRGGAPCRGRAASAVHFACSEAPSASSRLSISEGQPSDTQPATPELRQTSALTSPRTATLRAPWRVCAVNASRKWRCSLLSSSAERLRPRTAALLRRCASYSFTDASLPLYPESAPCAFVSVKPTCTPMPTRRVGTASRSTIAVSARIWRVMLEGMRVSLCPRLCGISRFATGNTKATGG